MAVIYEIRKPVGQYDLALPAYFRRVFGVGWDIVYGLLAIASFILCTWFEIDQNFYLLLLNTYFDMIIIFDASLSLFIRFYQSFQVVAVNPYIEAVYIALWNMLGLLLDLISCLPFILVLFVMDRKALVLSYQVICLLRFVRLYTTARRFLDKSLYEKVTNKVNEPLEDISLGDFGPSKLRRPISRKKLKKFLNRNQKQN